MAYKIALVGASQAEETEFRSLLTPAAQRLRQTWEVTSERDADLVVVDIDSVFGHMAWLKASGAGKRTAAFTERDSARESDLLLGRPLNLEGVVRLLLMYNLPASAAPVAMTPVVTEPTAYASEFSPGESMPPRAPAARAEPPSALDTPPRPQPIVRPAPAPPAPVAAAPTAAREQGLVDYLTSSPLAAAAKLVTEGAADLILDPVSQTWISSATGLRALAPHCTRGITPGDWQSLNGAELAAAKAAGTAQPYARLLWFYTLNRSQGELLPGLDRQARYKLGRYPQSEREFAKHFRIATFMMKNFSTLEEIAEASTAPLSDVIDYVNAYTAIGFVDNDRMKPSEMSDATKGVLSRLRNPFSR